MSAVLAQDLTIIPYETWQLAITGIAIVLSIVGVVTNMIVVIALAKQPSLSANHIFLFSMCLGNLLILIPEIIIQSLHLIHGGYSLGPMGCIIQSSLILSAENIGLLSVMLMTLDRYLVIMMEKYLSVKEIVFLLSQVWGMPFVMAAIAFGTNSQGFLFGLQSSGLYCMLSSWDAHLINRIEVVMVVFLLLQAMGGFFFVYGKIYLYYRAANRRKNKKKAQSGNERRLLIKCSSLAMSYFVIMAPFWIKMTYEVITSTPVSPEFDALAVAAVVFEPLSSSILVFLFDYSLKSTIREMFGLPPLKIVRTAPTTPKASKPDVIVHASQNKGANGHAKDAISSAVDPPGQGAPEEKTDIIGEGTVKRHWN